MRGCGSVDARNLEGVRERSLDTRSKLCEC